jgi:hypothetical protein
MVSCYSVLLRVLQRWSASDATTVVAPSGAGRASAWCTVHKADSGTCRVCASAYMRLHFLHGKNGVCRRAGAAQRHLEHWRLRFTSVCTFRTAAGAVVVAVQRNVEAAHNLKAEKSAFMQLLDAFECALRCCVLATAQLRAHGPRASTK